MKTANGSSIKLWKTLNDITAKSQTKHRMYIHSVRVDSEQTKSEDETISAFNKYFANVAINAVKQMDWESPTKYEGVLKVMTFLINTVLEMILLLFPA